MRLAKSALLAGLQPADTRRVSGSTSYKVLLGIAAITFAIALLKEQDHRLAAKIGEAKVFEVAASEAPLLATPLPARIPAAAVPALSEEEEADARHRHVARGYTEADLAPTQQFVWGLPKLSYAEAKARKHIHCASSCLREQPAIKSSGGWVAGSDFSEIGRHSDYLRMAFMSEGFMGPKPPALFFYVMEFYEPELLESQTGRATFYHFDGATFGMDDEAQVAYWPLWQEEQKRPMEPRCDWEGLRGPN